MEKGALALIPAMSITGLRTDLAKQLGSEPQTVPSVGPCGYQTEKQP